MTLVVVGFYVLFYTLLSIPAITNIIKDRASVEISKFLGAKVEIKELNILPFNEAQVKGIVVFDQNGNKCIEIENVGAGLRLWRLLLEGNIELSYGEIIGLKSWIIQETKDSPLNIDFIIKAFSKKEDNKEKTPFEFALHNVVLRKSSIKFLRPWMKDQHLGSLDLASLEIKDLAADITFPKISDQGITVDLRRLSFNIPQVTKVEKIKLNGEFGKEGFFINNFTLELPESRIYFPELKIGLKNGQNLSEALHNEVYHLNINQSYLTPADFSFLWAPLESLKEPLQLSVLLNGNLNEIDIEKFSFGSSDVLGLTFSGGIQGLNDFSNSKADVSNLYLDISSSLISKLISHIPQLSPKIIYAISNVGDFKLNGDLVANLYNNSFIGNLGINSDSFRIDIEGGFNKNSKDEFQGQGEINISECKIQHLFPSVPINNLKADLIAEGSFFKKDIQGVISLVIDNFEYKGKKYEGLSVNVSKNENDIEGDIWMDNEFADLSVAFKGDVSSQAKYGNLDLVVNNLNLSEIIDMKAYKNYLISGNMKAKADWVSINDLKGELLMNKFSFISPDKSRKLNLNQLKIKAEEEDSTHVIDLKSDWMDARFEGMIYANSIKKQLTNLAQTVFPILISTDLNSEAFKKSDFNFDIEIKNNNTVPEFFNLPFRFLVPVMINGQVSGQQNTAELLLDLPYLQQGRDKLIYDSRFKLNINGETGILDGFIETTMPVKKGDLALQVDLYGENNGLSTDISWINTENSDFNGHLELETQLSKNELSPHPIIGVDIKPSTLQMGSADWMVSPCNITYADQNIVINNLKISHDNQYVEISGEASKEYTDVLRVTLEDIDVDYVFDMLQINYVTFGGSASGEIAGHSLLSADPVAETESFKIKDLSYNGSMLGDCIVTSRWNNEEKEIEITADIANQGRRCVYASGGIFLGKDSLSFDINASKVPVGFVQPFMSVFSSHVGGFASGNVKLFGTFHDIDMTGKVFADSVAIKLDYTNTIYHGSDSVFLNPGQIEIPHFRLYDKYGNSAMMSGELTHRYFHDPSFNFRLTDASDFLCYDTNSDINPDWYGMLFGTGSAFLRGVPGLVDISADMTITGNSSFTFVLNDTQYAQDYQFLTFSDRRGEAKKKSTELTADDFKEMLKKRIAKDEGSLSRFGIDIRATVTPQALFTLVMDPAAGDKITARGKGAMQIKYESDNDEMMMYGKYEIEEGNYNFSLQDIILRDFKIKEGSYIAFNGNPLAAELDISATYRVNTNLSDLDKSFSTDRDLNRTNVPVDAVLMVDGNMQQPDITFDIELPTLTQDVERKVKSIISTDDMMNRQIIYLLALNRFYTPEYMGASGNGGELAAVASSTISSQLTNILGQLTDKFSVSPSFRSDKGDFSDIEVDVALSSRLLNNRLLINGNFGYRDRSNSSTTFVGDFDVEYLLSKNGNLRLKAYNHFNDQNYYLREALTTQGLGVVYRRDFDDWFTFLKKKKKKEEESSKDEDETQPESETEHNTELNGTED